MGLSFTIAAGPHQRSHSMGLAFIFYSLRFETSLVAASYDSQGKGGRIRLRLHRGATRDAETVLVIISRHGPHRKHRTSTVACVLVAAGTCLPSRCLETAAVYSPYLAVMP
jgi:hypothetical protein